MPEKKNIPPRLRAASVITNSYNEQDNTIEVIAATDSEVLQVSWDGMLREVLSMDAAHVRMQRLLSGAPALDNHQRYGSVKDTVVGVVTTARLESGKLICTIKFSEREDLKEFITDVKSGIIKNISIGYRVYKYEITEEVEKIPIYRAVDWEPFEVSFVPVPADYMAGVRSQQQISDNTVEIISTNTNNHNMKHSQILQMVRAAGLGIEFAEKLFAIEDLTEDKARTMIDAEKAAKSAPPAEHSHKNEKRSSEIINSVRAAGFDIAYAQELIDDEKMTVDKARAAIIAKMAEGQKPANPGNAAVNNTPEGEQRFRNDAINGLILRSGQIPENKLNAAELPSARTFQHSSLLRFAAMCLERAGVNISTMGDRQIAERAITTSTSDFPVVLENVMHKILLAAYATVPDTWRRFCRVGSVTDFRQHNRYRPGSLTRLDKVLANGELKNKALADATKESIKADTYGNIINISRETIINDDLGYFTSLAADLARAAALGIEVDVYAALALNSGNGPTMSDGNPLFHSSHGNIITGAAPSVASFDAIKTKMGRQKDHSGNNFLNLRPDILLLALEQGAAADAVNDSMYDPDAANKLQKKNTSYKTFKDIVATAYITGNEQYAFADPAIAAVMEVAFLNGVQTPYIEREDAFSSLGIKYRIYHDYGVGAIDWKGAVKNPGA